MDDAFLALPPSHTLVLLRNGLRASCIPGSGIPLPTGSSTTHKERFNKKVSDKKKVVSERPFAHCTLPAATGGVENKSDVGVKFQGSYSEIIGKQALMNGLCTGAPSKFHVSCR